MTTNIAGTPKYMSPEAFDGKRNAQTDIWSVGVLFYQMLVGSLPFPQKSYGELGHAVFHHEPMPLLDSIPIQLQKVRHHQQSRWLGEYDHLKGGRTQLH
jgi:serine/threonine protein kinase